MRSVCVCVDIRVMEERRVAIPPLTGVIVDLVFKVNVLINSGCGETTEMEFWHWFLNFGSNEINEKVWGPPHQIGCKSQ